MLTTSSNITIDNSTITTTAIPTQSLYSTSYDKYLYDIISSYNKPEPPAQDKQKPITFKKIEILNPNKVIRFTFNDNTVIKTICLNGDSFDFEYAFYLAIAKKLYSKELTIEGIEAKAKELSYTKEYVKIVEKGLKLYKNQIKEEEKRIKQEEEQKAIKARQEEKKRNRKKKIREAKINDIAEAIKRASAS